MNFFLEIFMIFEQGNCWDIAFIDNNCILSEDYMNNYS